MVCYIILGNGLFADKEKGIRIMMTYKYGSISMGLESVPLKVDLNWIGLLHDDVTDLPDECFMPLSANDKNVLLSLTRFFEVY